MFKLIFESKYSRLFGCHANAHPRYTCPSRKHALEKNLGYVKQIWVRKDDLSMLKRMGPKKS